MIQSVTALQRVGITFSEQQKDQIRVLQESGDILGAQTLILKELETQFGGVARAAAETESGGLRQLLNIFGDITEVIGEIILLGLAPFGDSLKETLITIRSFLQANKEIIALRLSAVFAAIGQAIGFIARSVGPVTQGIQTLVTNTLKFVAEIKLLGNEVETFFKRSATVVLDILENPLTFFTRRVNQFLRFLDRANSLVQRLTGGRLGSRQGIQLQFDIDDTPVRIALEDIEREQQAKRRAIFEALESDLASITSFFSLEGIRSGEEFRDKFSGEIQELLNSDLPEIGTAVGTALAVNAAEALGQQLQQQLGNLTRELAIQDAIAAGSEETEASLRQRFTLQNQILATQIRILEEQDKTKLTSDELFDLEEQIKDLRAEQTVLSIELGNNLRDLTQEEEKRLDVIQRQNDATRDQLAIAQDAFSRLNLEGELSGFGGLLGSGFGEFLRAGEAFTEGENRIEQLTQQLEGLSETSEEFRQLEIERDAAASEQRLSIASSFFGGFAALAKAGFEASGRENQKAFAAFKAFAIAQTIIDTIRAAQAAFASLAGIPIIGLGLATAAVATTIAAGTARVAQIAATEPAQSFHDGGLVAFTGNSARRREGFGRATQADEVNAVLQTGEFVVNRRGVAALDNLNRGNLAGLRSIQEGIDAFRATGGGAGFEDTQGNEDFAAPDRQQVEPLVSVTVPPPNVTINNQNVFDPSIVGDFVDTRDGEIAIRNVVRRELEG